MRFVFIQKVVISDWVFQDHITNLHKYAKGRSANVICWPPVCNIDLTVKMESVRATWLHTEPDKGDCLVAGLWKCLEVRGFCLVAGKICVENLSMSQLWLTYQISWNVFLLNHSVHPVFLIMETLHFQYASHLHFLKDDDIPMQNLDFSLANFSEATFSQTKRLEKFLGKEIHVESLETNQLLILSEMIEVFTIKQPIA